jgi:uncharacterized protein
MKKYIITSSIVFVVVVLLVGRNFLPLLSNGGSHVNGNKFVGAVPPDVGPSVKTSAASDLVADEPGDLHQQLAQARDLMQSPTSNEAAIRILENLYLKDSSVRPEAAFLLAQALEDHDPARAITLMTEAENAGRQGSTMRLAILLDRHQPSDLRIENLWRKAAQSGDPWAMVTVAQRWHDMANLDKAIGIFQSKHDEGHPRVSIDLIRLYAENGLRPDAAQHRRWLEEAAPRSAVGSLLYGQYVLDTSRDPERAAIGIRWLEHAIEQGSSGAETVLGRLLLYGNQLVDAQPERAAALLASAAEQGSTTAMHIYANILFNGVGVEADPAKGATWLTKAAESGHQWAQAELGRRLIDGDLVAQDLTDGRRWLARAADQGNQQAIERLRMLQ